MKLIGLFKNLRDPVDECELNSVSNEDLKHALDGIVDELRGRGFYVHVNTAYPGSSEVRKTVKL